MPKLIRFPEVIARTALSRSAVYEAIAAGSFPKPVKIGGRLNAWPESEISDWIDARIADREAA